jgi:hypothetical protein
MVKTAKANNQFLSLLEKETGLRGYQIYKPLGWTKQKYWYCRTNNSITHQNLMQILQSIEITPMQLAMVLVLEAQLAKQES